MFKSQAVADLAILLSSVTSPLRAHAAIARALRAADLAEAPTVDERDLRRLFAALAAEGGPIEQLAVQIAMRGLGAPTNGPSPTDERAA